MTKFPRMSKFMDEEWPNAKRPVLILFIFLVAYLVYRDHNLFDFLYRIIIQPYIFKFSPKSLLSTTIFLATIIALFFRGYENIRNKPIPSLDVNLAIFSFLTILVIERIRLNKKFTFTEIIPNLSYYDFILLVILCYILISTLPFFCSRLKRTVIRKYLHFRRTLLVIQKNFLKTS